MTRVLKVATALLLVTALAGCGKVGQLERPGPLFGKAKAADDAARPQDPTRPVQTVDPRDRSTDNIPVRAAPIPGSGQSATTPAPATALPDPYARPR